MAFVGYSVTYSFGTPGRTGRKRVEPPTLQNWCLGDLGPRVSMFFWETFSREEEVYIYIIYIYILFFFQVFLGVQFLGDDDPFLLGFGLFSGESCYLLGRLLPGKFALEPFFSMTQQERKVFSCCSK